jgi:selenocysteine lyase/cysteine desulfurase
MSLKTKLGEIRENFPLIDDVIYLGAAGSGPFNLIVYNAVMECWNRRRYGSRVGGVGHAWFSQKEVMAKEETAKFINADPDEICFVSRVVQGLNLVKNIIDYNFPWKKGDNIVFTDQAYPSSGHTWLSLKKKGVELRKVENVNGRILVDDFEKAVDEKTKLVSINRTSVGSGFTYDVKTVCDIAHEKGAYVVDDAIQTLGAKTIDVHHDDVDFLVSGSYKWQLGPPEAGLFYARLDLCEKLEPSYWSYINVDKGPKVEGMARFPFGAKDHDPVESYNYPFFKTAQRFEMGTTATDQLWAWHAVLKWFNKLGKEKVDKRAYEIGGYLIERLLDIDIKVQTPLEPEPDTLNTHRHALIMYTTGDYDLDMKTIQAMPSRLVKPIIGPTMKYQGGFGGVRVSPHIYNTREEIDVFVDYLLQVIKEES